MGGGCMRLAWRCGCDIQRGRTKESFCRIQFEAEDKEMAVSDYKNSFLTIKGMSSSYHSPPPGLSPHRNLRHTFLEVLMAVNGPRIYHPLPAFSSFSSPQNSNLIIIIIIFYPFFLLLSNPFISFTFVFSKRIKISPQKIHFVV